MELGASYVGIAPAWGIRIVASFRLIPTIWQGSYLSPTPRQLILFIDLLQRAYAQSGGGRFELEARYSRAVQVFTVARPRHIVERARSELANPGSRKRTSD